MNGVFKLLLFCLLFSCRILSAETDSRYRIAAILPLTGQVASMGGYLKSGLDLAYQKLSEDQKKQIEIVYEDDQFNPTLTIAAYRKLSIAGRLDAVFVLGSPTANALVPLVERNKNILIAIGASDPGIAIGKQFSFIHWVIPSVLGETLAHEIARRNLKKIAIVSAQTTGALADADALTQALAQVSKENCISYRHDVLATDTDFRSTIAKVRDKSVDGVVAVLFPGALSSFAKQFRASGIKAELIGMETFEDESEVAASAGALEGAWFVNAASPTAGFVSQYQEKFSRYPGWGVANAFDTLNLLAKGLEQAKREPEQMRNFLRSIQNYQGAAGKYSASGDNRFLLPAELKQIVKGTFERINHGT